MPTPREYHRLIGLALGEDNPWGDLTSEHLIPAKATAVASLVAREDGVLSGMDSFIGVFRGVSQDLVVTPTTRNGSPFTAGDVLATVRGSARDILGGERVALNIVQRMSGIATLTARYVAAVAGTEARIVDTRKTTPGMRAHERRAVRDGGGHNHRRGLSDAVLVKDNHLAVLAANGVDFAEALRTLRTTLSHTTFIEVEVDRLDQIPVVLDAGVDAIMLDNFTLPDLRAGVEVIAGRALVEASGNVSLDTVAAIAATGVDLVSVGALTHSAPAIDLGLDITPTDGDTA